MLIFPLIYLLSFLISLILFFQKKPDGFLFFVIVGLPIYTTSLSICFINGYRTAIPFLQSFKEIIILLSTGMALFYFKREIKLLLLDKLIISFIILALLYLFIPSGSYGFTEKLLAFKSLVFFYLLYFLGRYIDLSKVYLNKYFHFISYISIASAIVLGFEIFYNTHLQTHTGYAIFNDYYYGAKPEGNYDLSWAFERTDGMKRFASFYANPLEYGASTLIVLPIVFAMYTSRKNRFLVDPSGILTILATLMAIIFAVSRASFISYFFIVYAYAFITNKKNILHLLHLLVASILIYLLIQINNKGLAQFIIESINLKDTSTIGHITEWVEGINALIQNPFGLGLGESGRVANAVGANIGGENQFIIVGVQLGIIGLLINIAIYITSIVIGYKWLNRLKGRERKLCMAVLLMKISFIVPLMTSNFESYTYISFISWFFTGLLINMIDRKIQNENKIVHVNAN